MKAIITGASSGLGFEMAKVLSEKGYEIIAVARRAEKLAALKEQLKTNVEILCADVTNAEDIKKIAVRIDEADVFVNNAGFGVFGKFYETDLECEIEMLETNVKAVHILTKLAVQSFMNKNRGYILNVSSIAAFFPGPLFAGYYAGKSYVLRLTQSVYEELRRAKSAVKISALCPGPVKTEFEKVAKMQFGNGNEPGRNLIIADKEEVARYATEKMFKGKVIIIPGRIMRIFAFLRRLISEKLLCKVIYLLQSKKIVS